VLDTSSLLARRHSQRELPLGPLPARPRRTREEAHRVLLVDDSPIFRSVIANLLSELGCRVSLAEDGREGLELLQSLLPDLLVTDIQMPRMDGIELIRCARADARLASLPIIAVSTLAAMQDRQRALNAGANAYLVKSDLSAGGVAEVLERLLI
jgi:two-component system chemotaxis sensor kinase CheA